MDDGADYPDFGNAYPTTATTPATESASWNPALKEDAYPSHTTPADDDFFDRYPGATPKKDMTIAQGGRELAATSDSASADEALHLDEDVQNTVDIQQDDVLSDQLRRAPETGEGLLAENEHEGDNEAGVHSNEDAQDAVDIQQDDVLSNQLSRAPETGDGLPAENLHEGDNEAGVMGGDDEEEPIFKADEALEQEGELAAHPPVVESVYHAERMNERPEERYEHQGEVTAMEEALDESAHAPLMEDEEAPPTIEPSTSPYGTPSKAQAAPPSIDRSFTTNFTDVSAEAEPLDMPSNQESATGDDQTFAELLDGEEFPAPVGLTSKEELVHHPDDWPTGDDDTFGELAEGGGVGEAAEAEDLSAAWQAALDDDDLLDESNDLDPSKFFTEDDDGFLEDEDPPPSPQAARKPQAQDRPDAPKTFTAPYTITSQLTDQAHGRAAGTPDTGLFDVYNQGPQQQLIRPALQQAQSFADKSKGGYQSPYDLPMEVVKPRRRPAQQPIQQSNDRQAPPPRSSSFQSQPSTYPATSNGPATPSVDSGFFADLPVVAKPRARPSGAYTPQPGAPVTSGNTTQSFMGPPQSFSRQSGPPTQPPPGPAIASQQTAKYTALRQPERMPLLPDQPAAQVTQQSPIVPPPSNMRYSSNSNARYSPAPSSQPPRQPAPYAPSRETSFGPVISAQSVHPFAPRTSSPLAYQRDKPHPPLPSEAVTSMTSSPPRLTGGALLISAGLSPERQPARYSPISTGFAAPIEAVPPRARTQSPSQTAKQPLKSGQMEARPTSAMQSNQPEPTFLHRRRFSRDLPFATPTDERASDPLERWKGHPIFKWSPSGAIISSFPQQNPYYAAGHGIPSIKCTPGTISLQNASTVMPMDERNAKFPGPLPTRGKGKKRDVLTWLGGKIEGLERDTQTAVLDFSLPADVRKRADEKVVLWKLMRIFVEHDGVLEGNPKIEEEVRRVLLPNLAQMTQEPSATSTAHAEIVDDQVLLQLRQALFQGQRERAVWLAEEKRLWGHAMLIASTLGPDTWRQIIQAFVRSQVKSERSLAALYQIFAGNSDDCVDELVPPSARAGFHMVSKIDGSVAGNPLEGLDQWRETLGLVASNRTPSDAASLVALGKLLSVYGRVEAATCCFLFARQVAKHSGADDKEAHFVLLGGSGDDLDSILLTEVYEWAASLSASSSYLPHLQPYKLLHAQTLAAYGLKSKAQQYCEHITAAYTSTTRPSQYYHPTFTSAVADLSAFLSQTPQDGKGGGLFSKPAMNKVSTGAASWFTKFVSGEDDAPGQASNGVEDAGPFGRVSGEISRNPSTTDLYNPMAGRYAPSNAASGSVMSGLPRLDLQEQRPSSARAASSRYAPAPVGSDVSLGVPRPEAGRAASDYGVVYSRRGSAQDSHDTTSDIPRPEVDHVESSGYEPPTTYQSYEPEPDSPDDAPKPKRSFMDDDEDDAAMAARAAALKKAQADRAADEAFRKAAEADAARDDAKLAEEKKAGWFGGWFGGKPGAAKEGDLNKPIRAKLGDESSFYYDETLKKWVNKKGGSESATPAAATPPPPRAPPSRVTSGIPSRTVSGTGLGSGPPSRAVTPAAGNDDVRPSSGPPSRPPTSMSTASSLDDLLGGPPGGGRKAGGTVKGKKKGGRYVDIMAK